MDVHASFLPSVFLVRRIKIALKSCSLDVTLGALGVLFAYFPDDTECPVLKSPGKKKDFKCPFPGCFLRRIMTLISYFPLSRPQAPWRTPVIMRQVPSLAPPSESS